MNTASAGMSKRLNPAARSRCSRSSGSGRRIGSTTFTRQGSGKSNGIRVLQQSYLVRIQNVTMPSPFSMWSEPQRGIPSISVYLG